MPSNVFQIVDLRLADHSPHFTSESRDELLGERFAELVEALEVKRDYVLTASLFGRTAEGKSVCAHVRGFRPDLYYAGGNAADVARAVARAIGESESNVRGTVETRYRATTLTLDDDGERVAERFVRLTFRSLRHYYAAARLDKPRALHKFSLESKFFLAADLLPSGWAKVEGGRLCAPSQASTCDFEYDCTVAQIAAVEIDDVAPLRCLSFDIESVSEEGGFPKKEKDSDVVCTISFSLRVLGSDERRKWVVTLGTCDPIEGAEVIETRSEVEFLEKARAVIVTSDADFVRHYNGFGFDLPYLWTRATPPEGSVRPACQVFAYLGKFKWKACPFREKALNSDGLGSNMLYYVDMDGRSHMDLFMWYKSRYSEASYKLDDVARRVTGEAKLDFPYHLIKPYYHGTSAQRKEMAAYCLQDSELLDTLDDKLQAIVADVEQSRVCRVLVQRLVTHGQGVKVMSMIAKKLQRCEGVAHPFVLDNKIVEEEEQDALEKYQGATVVEPITGYYKDLPVIVVDFASLYPSIMIAHNLCRSTMARPQDVGKPGVLAYPVADGRTHHFSTKVKGILPSLVAEVLGARKKVKKMLAAVEAELDDDALDPERRRQLKARALVYDKRQLALKISANSVYGYTGSKTAEFGEQAVAETVTHCGRVMLEESTELCRARSRPLRKADGEPVGEFKLVYGDTDSLMFTLSNVRNPTDGFAAGLVLADDVTAEYQRRGQRAKQLEMEKCFWPWILFSKKRYVGELWNQHRDGSIVSRGIKHSGTARKRRDFCGYVHKMYDAICDPLMKRDQALALANFHAGMQRMVDGAVEFDDFVLTSGLKDEYKSAEQLQLKVVAKQKARDPGSETKPGDRMSFVYLKGAPNAKACDMAEDAAHARAHGLPLNMVYYATNQVMNPVMQLLEHIHPNAEGIFMTYVEEMRRRASGAGSLAKFVKTSRTREDDAKLLGGKKKAKAASAPPAGALSRFLKEPS